MQKEVQNILIKPDTLLTVKGFTKIIFKVSILEIAGKELSQDCLFLHFSLNLYLCENLAWPQYKEAVPGMIHQMATKLATDRDTDMDKQIRHHLPEKNSASADGGPRSRVCPHLTLRSPPLNTNGIFSSHMSEGGG